MAYSGGYRSVPPEDIRSAGITYAQLLMRCFDRMDLILSETTKEEAFRAVDAKIRLIDGLMYPYHTVDYTAKRDKIEARLKKMGDWNYEYFKILMEWVKLMSSKFSEMDILPVQKIGFIMGVGPADEHMELLK